MQISSLDEEMTAPQISHGLFIKVRNHYIIYDTTLLFRINKHKTALIIIPAPKVYHFTTVCFCCVNFTKQVERAVAATNKANSVG